jgi:hypothetical protein
MTFALMQAQIIHVLPGQWRSRCQRFANESPELNANKRCQSSSVSSGFTGVSRERDPLITVWLEVT